MMTNRVAPARALVDGDLRVVAVNGAVARLTGVPSHELRGTRLDDWINLSPLIRERLRNALRHCTADWVETIPLGLAQDGGGSAVVRLTQVPGEPPCLLISLIAIHLTHSAAPTGNRRAFQPNRQLASTHTTGHHHARHPAATRG